MIDDDDLALIDEHHTRCLCDVGAPGYLAATAVSADGTTNLVLACVEDLNDENVRCDPTCSVVAHEQLGALPIEFLLRIMASRPVHRCGRRTLAGHPCRIPV